MINKIEVSGYQSLYNVEVELGSFTVVYGESNVGKSAFYRALKGLVSSERGDSFISKGRKQAKVKLWLDSLEEAIEWKKGKGKSAGYSFGETSWKRCQDLPEELKKKLKMSPIKLFGDSFYPNFHGQFEPLFLIFESPGKRAKLLGWLISNILLDGIRNANRERNQRVAEVRSLKDFLVRLKERKEVDWDDLLKRLYDLYQKGNKIEKLTGVYEDLSRAASEFKKNKRLLETEFEEIEETKWKRTRKLLGILDELRRLKRAREELLDITEELEFKKETFKGIKEEIKEVKKKMYFPCPKCGHKISILEIEK